MGRTRYLLLGLFSLALAVVAVAFAHVVSPIPISWAAERIVFDFPPLDTVALAALILAAVAFGLAGVRYLAGEPSRPQNFLARALQRLGRLVLGPVDEGSPAAG